MQETEGATMRSRRSSRGAVAGSRSPLAPFDVIEIGNSETVLLFVPLCGSRFEWINGLKGGAVRCTVSRPCRAPDGC